MNSPAPHNETRVAAVMGIKSATAQDGDADRGARCVLCSQQSAEQNDVSSWPVASFCGDAAIASRSE